jgi:YD repeat-containing protein
VTDRGAIEVASLREEEWIMRSMRRCSAWLVAGCLAFGASVAHAQETTTYTYDALGRVTGVVRSGGPANGTNTTYAYDPASNRTNVTVNNSPNGTPSSDGGNGATVQNARYVIVPLNGYTLIRISQ